MSKSFKSRALLGAAAAALAPAAILASAVMSPAFAQETDDDDTITVTGTRIQNPNLEQSSQIRSVDENEIRLQNVNAAEELLRQLPGAVPNVGPAVNNGANGAQTFNLRGIGSNRNLVLLDGKRIVPFGLTGTTDLNHIPIALIQRTDVVSGGASTVYGADAVSGLVNFITKQDFEGVELQSSFRTTEQGDGEVFRTELLIGGDFADGRGNAVFSVGYQDANAVLQGDRDFSVFNVSSITGNNGGSSAAVPTVVAGGTLGTLQFNPTTGALDPFSIPFNFNPLNIFQTPVERFNIFTAGHYDVNDWVQVYGQAFYTRSSIRQQIAPTATFFNTYELPISNPFLPDPARDQICAGFGISPAECLAADAVTDPDDPAFRSVNTGLRRRFVEQGPRISDFTTDAFQFSGGLRGDLTETWSWDLSAQYGESFLFQRNSGSASFSRAQQALFAVDTTTCVDPTGGCVPLNLFGPEGSITDAQLGFLQVVPQTTTETSLGVVNLSATGDLGSFKSPWAETAIGVAVGGEYRRYTAASAGDFLSSVPGEVLGAGGADPAVSGNYDVIEGYFETIIPVLEDSFAGDFTVEGGLRISDYSTSGSSLTYKAGGSWQPIEGFKVRSIYQRAVRSPNIAELFFPVQTVLDNFATDPCAGAAPVGNAALAAVCIAQGAPAGSIGFISDPAAGQVNVTGGGNPDLDVERATTLTAGIVVQPPQIENLTFSFDYFNINVVDAISSPAVGDVIDGCFDPAFNPSLTFNASCALVSRNAVDGSLNGSPADTLGLILATSNLGRINTSGFDLGVNYGFDLGSAGRISYGFNGTYTLENRFQATPASEDRDCVGFYSTNCGNIQPELQFNQRITWSYNIFDVSLEHRYLGGVEIEPAVAGSFQPEFETIDAYNYLDLSLRASPMEWVQFTATIDNLLDNEPPIVGADVGPTSFNSGNTYPTVYDALGRTYTFAVRLTF